MTRMRLYPGWRTLLLSDLQHDSQVTQVYDAHVRRVTARPLLALTPQSDYYQQSKSFYKLVVTKTAFILNQSVNMVI